MFNPTAVPAAEHRRVFNYTSRVGSTFLPVQQPSPSRHTVRRKIPTCTIKFVCLNNVGATKPPGTVAEKTALANSGLGPGIVSFAADGKANHLHQKLLEKFPALSSGGGYELLLYQRGGLQHGFHKISPPYTPARIKEVAAQARVYIRPLQKNLKVVMQEGMYLPAYEEVSVAHGVSHNLECNANWNIGLDLYPGNPRLRRCSWPSVVEH